MVHHSMKNFHKHRMNLILFNFIRRVGALFSIRFKCAAVPIKEIDSQLPRKVQ